MLFGLHKARDLSDEKLSELYKKTGKPEYFGELYNRYIPLLYGVCLKYLRNAAEAEDAVMQIYENLANKITEYDIKVFRTWIYSVAKNHCLQILRKTKKEIIVDFDSQIVESAQIIHLFDEDENEPDFEALKRCLEKLPEPQRIGITKFFTEGMSYAEISEHTGYDLKSVKSRIQNGKRNLKICMEKQKAYK